MAITGVLVNKSADQTSADYSAGVDIAFDAEVYDSDGIHDNATNNERLTIPASLDGKFAIFTIIVVLDLDGSVSNNGSLELRKNGSNFLGGAIDLQYARGTVAAGSTQRWMSITSPPILLATGDYYTANMYLQDTSVTVLAAETTFGMRVLATGTDTHRVLCKKSTDETGSDYSTAANVAWDAEDYDTDSFHDNATNNDRITIPAGLNGKYGLFTAELGLSSVVDNADVSVAIIQNAAGYLGGAFYAEKCNNTFAGATLVSQPTLLTTADYYTVILYCSDTDIGIYANESRFGLRVLD